MFSQEKKKLGVKSGEMKETNNDSVKSQSSSQYSQIYFEHWEKENLKQNIFKKKENKSVIVKSEQKIKNILQNKVFEAKKYNEGKPVKLKKKVEKIIWDKKDRNVENLLAENKKLKESLEHSRKVSRELVIKLREERERKRFRKEDFQTIQNVLKRYM